MAFDSAYREDEPTREEIDRSKGLLLLEFGANWCGHCQALSPTVEALLNANPQVQHVRIADGRGKPLGRSFRVKLWPTVVLMRDGQIVSQLVRPTAGELEEQFEPFSRADAAGT
jgi:thioredoxin 1